MTLRKWQKIGSRVLQMDRAELWDRFRQEFAKRQDTALAVAGFDFARRYRKAGVSEPGVFFFRADSIDSIVSLLRERLPRQAERIVRQAEKICHHRFDLLGYEDLDYGNPIDWHVDPVHGKRAPRKPFYRVRYLDYDEVGDSKITWELNRHQHLVTLAKAYRITGDQGFAAAVLSQWRDWNKENPYPIGINWASSLETAFRSLAWIWTYHLLEHSPAVPPEFKEQWLRGLALHGRHIERYLSTYFAPNTHLLGEAVALFFLGVLFPELSAAERWKKLGCEIVLREAERQVQADGFHFEQSTYYHVYALDFFLHFALLASINNIPVPDRLEMTLEKMLNALSLLGRAGPPPQFGDDDGGRVFDPRRNQSEHMLDPLATGAILFNRGEYKTEAGDLREETIWLLGKEGVRRWDELETVPQGMESARLSSAGFYLLSAPEAKAQMVVDAGRQGWGRGGHGHADALSVWLNSHGTPLLIDSGTFEYVGSGEDRNLYRGTAAHNTLRVDGQNQAETVTPFSWARLTETKVERWIQGQQFDLIAASHNGYQRLNQPVTHYRWVVSLKTGIYFVRDVVEGEGKHRLDLSWHLSQDLQMVEENVFRIKGGSHGLAILPAQLLGSAGALWREEVRKEFWSPAYGKKAPMTVINFSVNTDLPTEYAVLILALDEVHGNPGSLERIGTRFPDSPLSAYRFQSAGLEYAFYFGRSGESWTQHHISSDAEFVCRKRSAGNDQQLILCNGSYAAIEGGPEMRLRRRVSWGEAAYEKGETKVLSSDPDAIEEKSAAPERETPGILT